MISADRLADRFVSMADTLVDDFDLIEFLHRLTDHAAEVSGADAVGLVLADHRGTLQFMAASNAAGKALELFQLQGDEGPCLDCFTTGRAVVNVDLGGDDAPWPTFSPHVSAAGFVSVHAFPLKLRGQTIGALNLFSKKSTRFEDDEVRVVQALADIATIALIQERSITRSQTLTEQLQSALNSRILIEQAKGAVAQARGVSVDEAFAQLRQEARRTRTRLVDVARAVLPQ